MARGSELTVQLPNYYDADNDKVELIVSIKESMKAWIQFDQRSREFTVKPTNETAIGLTRVQVYLSDRKSTSTYWKNFWVTEASPLKASNNITNIE